MKQYCLLATWENAETYCYNQATLWVECRHLGHSAREVDIWPRGCIHPVFLLNDLLCMKETQFFPDTDQQQARDGQVKVQYIIPYGFVGLRFTFQVPVIGGPG